MSVAPATDSRVALADVDSSGRGGLSGARLRLKRRTRPSRPNARPAPAATGERIRARPVEQTAPLGQRRPVRDGAAFALPGGVLAAGTREGVDDHVSWQQPVTARTALGRCVHPVCVETADRVVNISSHTHHIGISHIRNPGRWVNRYDSLSSHRRVVVSHSRGRSRAAPTQDDGPGRCRRFIASGGGLASRLNTSCCLAVKHILLWVVSPRTIGRRPVIAATDGPAPSRNPICPACGYPYAGPALCGWCRFVQVLTYDEIVRPAAQAG